MTNKEAYQLIESCLWYDKDMSETPEAYVEAIRIAKEVFDKQEPMKPVNTGETYDNYGETFYEYTCPLCETYIEVSGIMGYQPNYCDNCGQKLDWED